MYMGNVAHFLCKCSFWCDNSLKSCLLFWANCVPATRISCSDLFSLAKLWWLYIANKIFSPMSSQTTIFGFIPSDFQSSDANDLVGTNIWMQVPCNHGNKTCIPYLTKIKWRIMKVYLTCTLSKETKYNLNYDISLLFEVWNLIIDSECDLFKWTLATNYLCSLCKPLCLE